MNYGNTQLMANPERSETGFIGVFAMVLALVIEIMLVNGIRSWCQMIKTVNVPAMISLQLLPKMEIKPEPEMTDVPEIEPVAVPSEPIVEPEKTVEIVSEPEPPPVIPQKPEISIRQVKPKHAVKPRIDKPEISVEMKAKSFDETVSVQDSPKSDPDSENLSLLEEKLLRLQENRRKESFAANELRESVITSEHKKPRDEKIVTSYLAKVSEILNRRKKYPEKARNEGIQGRVIVAFTINRAGEPSKLKLIENPHPLLGDAAILMFRNLRFPKPPEDFNPERELVVPVSYSIK